MRSALAIGLVGLVAIPAARPAVASRGHTCALARARTVVRTSHARIYKRDGYTYGCLFRIGRRVKLGTYAENLLEKGGQRNFALAGRLVAYEDYTVGQDGAQYWVRDVDLRSGRTIHDVQTGRVPRYAEVQRSAYGVGHTTRIAALKSGAVAWIAQDAYATAPRYEVHELTDHHVRLLDQGGEIDPNSLRTANGELIWASAGSERSAPFS